MAEDIDNIINVTDVASKGVVFDTPPVALAPNIMTNVRNVRFKAGAIRKMEGELLLTDLELDDNIPTNDYKLGAVQYFAVWEEPSISPTQCYYITVRDFVLESSGATVGQKVFIQNAIKSTDSGYLRRDITPPIGTQLETTSNLTATQTTVGSTTLTVSPNNAGIVVGYYVEAVGVPEGARVTNINGTTITIDKKTDSSITAGTDIAFKLYSGFAVTTTGWGHTLFGGGFAFILNNGIDRPHHIKLDPEASAITDIELLALPGWDSYFGHSEPVKDVWNDDPDFVPVFALGQELDFSLNTLYVRKTRGTTTTVLVPEAGNPAGSNAPLANPNNFDITTSTQAQVASGATTITIPYSVTNPQSSSPIVKVGDYVFLRDQLGIPKNTIVTKIDIVSSTSPSTITISNATTEIIPNSEPIRFITPPGRDYGYKIPNNFVPGAYPGDSAWVSPTFEGQGNLKVPRPDFYQVYYDEDTGVTLVSIGGLEKDDEISIQIRTRNIIRVSCGIIESFGNLIVAGNLKTTDATNTTKVLRRQPGVIRVSDVAATDSFPTNWNPFAGSASTADEFTLSETSVVKDMKTLQSNFYIYSTEGIHQLRLTGNTNLPVSFTSVTETYGALSTKSVAEYDGRHFVVGKNDIYSFTGNPADIKSLCDNRTRLYFYNNLNPSYLDKTFVLANHRLNEIWINYPTVQSTTGACNEALIYNYRDNTWTIRDLNNVKAGDIGPVVGGGLPEATLALNNGNSGNNLDTGNAGYTNIGHVQVQTTILASVPSPSASQIYAAPRGHGDIKVRFDFEIKDTYTTDTRSARQWQKFTWTADASTGGSGSPYRSSGIYESVEYGLTWVLYIQNGGPFGIASIGITLTTGLTTLADILDDIVYKINNQVAAPSNHPTYYGGGSMKQNYFALRIDNHLYLEAKSTGPRDTFPTTSTGSASIPANGVFFYIVNFNYQGNSYGYRQGIPQINRTNAGTLIGANFPVPNSIVEEDIWGNSAPGTTVSGKPETTLTIVLNKPYPHGNPDTPATVSYPLHFDGLLNPTTFKRKITYFFNQYYPENGYTAIGNLTQGGLAPASGFSGIYILANDSGKVSSTSAVIQGRDSSILPISEWKFTNNHNGFPAATTDTITINFSLGESLTTPVTNIVWNPEIDTTTTFVSNTSDARDITNYIVGQYNASFGGINQPRKYFTPAVVFTGSSGRITWTRVDEGANVDPISWTITPGTARDNYIPYSVSQSGHTLIASSTPDLILTNTGADKAYATLTRATLKIINNGVSTTVLDKRYGEGPGRLALEPLSGINGAGENPYGSTNATTDAEYLALYYDTSVGTSGASILPNGVSVPLKDILLDVITALSPYSDKLSIEPDDSLNPTSVVVKPLEYSSSTNYVESFTVSTGAEATVAKASSEFNTSGSAYREGATNAGTSSTLASTSTVNTTLSNIRPWSTNEVNDLKKFPIFAQNEGTSNRLRVADLGFDFAGTKYVSFFERDQLSITTTFNTETVNSMVLWADGASKEDVTNKPLRATLHIRARGTNASGTESLLTSTDTNDAKLITNSFIVATDYKVDARVQGRFINYRIDDAALDYTAANDREWHVSGLQLETLRGGTR